ncbi:FHA domain-containing protein [Flexibacterium corallicola]|uniref:FHA domain-containing protein n=1 Tax=Flexibacterium corallicola TaxID=3037259 RepID=UPI00286F3DA8|nr:FHA domain-containing protein [Pseudovibrio sp. M1P-2-3]
MTLSIQLLQIPEGCTALQREYYLDQGSLKIGRDYEADICLQDQVGTLSRTHLVIAREEDGQHRVVDTSINGTYLNNTRLQRNEPWVLADGDVLSFCDYKLLIGIVVRREVREPEASPKQPRLSLQTDMNSTVPFFPEAEVEPVPQSRKEGFQQEDVQFEQDLMFDPFAEGPGLKVEPEDFQNTAFEEAENLSIREQELDALTSPLVNGQHMRAYRENISEAMERALERFLSEIDPETLQSDLEAYAPWFANKQKRYWQVYRNQFSRKRANREFHRTFLALFAEEMRRG